MYTMFSVLLSRCFNTIAGIIYMGDVHSFKFVNILYKTENMDTYENQQTIF